MFGSINITMNIIMLCSVNYYYAVLSQLLLCFVQSIIIMLCSVHTAIKEVQRDVVVRVVHDLDHLRDGKYYTATQIS